MKKILLIIPILLILFFFLPLKKVLSVYSRKSPSQSYYFDLKSLEDFTISYTHSVNKGRVHDVYLPIQKNKLKLDKTIFVSYGAGIPEPSETEGAKFSITENGYQIENLNRTLNKLTMAVGIVANHHFSLNYKNEKIDFELSKLFEPQTSIIFEIKNICVADFLIKKLKGDPNGQKTIT